LSKIACFRKQRGEQGVFRKKKKNEKFLVNKNFTLQAIATARERKKVGEEKREKSDMEMEVRRLKK
jgi:hypothetical protein